MQAHKHQQCFLPPPCPILLGRSRKVFRPNFRPLARVCQIHLHQVLDLERISEFTELESRVELAKSTKITADDLQILSLDLAKLTKTLVDATGSLPSYDQRQYELVRVLLVSCII
jgi:hypothetical protein